VLAAVCALRTPTSTLPTIISRSVSANAAISVIMHHGIGLLSSVLKPA
jgi:hypothetical protein